MPEPNRSAMRAQRRKLDAALESRPLEDAVGAAQELDKAYVYAMGPGAAPAEHPDPGAFNTGQLRRDGQATLRRNVGFRLPWTENALRLRSPN